MTPPMLTPMIQSPIGEGRVFHQTVQCDPSVVDQQLNPAAEHLFCFVRGSGEFPSDR